MSNRHRAHSRSPTRGGEDKGSRESWRLRQERSRDHDDDRPSRHRPSWWRERVSNHNYRRRSEGNYGEERKNYNDTNNVINNRSGEDRGRRLPRRRSLEPDKEPRPIVLNPTDVPRAERYFDHDNRLGGGGGHSSSNATPISSSRRPRIDSTPAKWGHDMFEKITAEEQEEEEEQQDERTRSVVSKVVIPNVSKEGTESGIDHETTIKNEDALIV